MSARPTPNLKLKRKRSHGIDQASSESSANTAKRASLPAKHPRTSSVSRAHDRAVHDFIDVLEELECCQPDDAGGPIVVRASAMLMGIKHRQRQLFDKLQQTTDNRDAKRLELRKQATALEALNLESAQMQAELKSWEEFPTPQLERMARDELKDPDSNVKDVINLFLCGSVLKSHEEPKQHEAIMQKLHKELNARGSLERDIKIAQKKLLEQKKVQAEKQQFFTELPHKLELMEQASLPLQNFFQAASDADRLTSDRRKRLDLAKALPGPLYTLFVQLQSHLDSTTMKEGSTLGVVTLPKGARKGDPIFDKNSVQWTFLLPDFFVKEGINAKSPCPTMTIDFFYYPALKVVTAKATGSPEKIDPETVLVNLFPGDDGEFTLLQVGDMGRKLSGKPYSWCNYMAGLHLATPDALSITLCTKVIVAQLSQRVRSNATLTQLIHGFVKCKVHPVHPAMAPGDIFVDPACLAKMHSFAEHEGKAGVYQATIKRKTVTLRAVVTLDLSRYPVVPPMWSLVVGEEAWGELYGTATSLDAGTNPLYDNTLGTIERSVNANVIGLVKQDVPETHDWILSHQLQTIVSMWDKTQKASEDGGCFGVRPLKGRDRM
jgi:Fms-interacting protein/Thoc5